MPKLTLTLAVPFIASLLYAENPAQRFAAAGWTHYQNGNYQDALNEWHKYLEWEKLEPSLDSAGRREIQTRFDELKTWWDEEDEPAPVTAEMDSIVMTSRATVIPLRRKIVHGAKRPIGWFYEKGEAARQSGQLDAALKLYHAARRLYPDDAQLISRIDQIQKEME